MTILCQSMCLHTLISFIALKLRPLPNLSMTPVVLISFNHSSLGMASYRLYNIRDLMIYIVTPLVSVLSLT